MRRIILLLAVLLALSGCIAVAHDREHLRDPDHDEGHG